MNQRLWNKLNVNFFFNKKKSTAALHTSIVVYLVYLGVWSASHEIETGLEVYNFNFYNKLRINWK